MNDLLQRLRERKLVQWGLPHAAAAFALLQGLDIVAQQFGWPEGVRRGITIALVVGFFVRLCSRGITANAARSASAAPSCCSLRCCSLSAADCCGAFWCMPKWCLPKWCQRHFPEAVL
jgi:hypothetical protein